MSRFRSFKYWLWLHHLWFSIDKLGVSFFYSADEVIYVWPWVRQKYRFLSVCCGGGFHSLTSLRCFWIGYELYERRAMRRYTESKHE